MDLRRFVLLLMAASGLLAIGAVATGTAGAAPHAALASIGSLQVGVGVSVLAPSPSPRTPTPTPPSPTPPTPTASRHPTGVPPQPGGASALPTTGTAGDRLIGQIVVGTAAVVVGCVLVWFMVARRRRASRL